MRLALVWLGILSHNEGSKLEVTMPWVMASSILCNVVPSNLKIQTLFPKKDNSKKLKAVRYSTTAFTLSASSGIGSQLLYSTSSAITLSCYQIKYLPRALNLTALLGVRLHSFSGASTFIKHAHTKNVPLGSRCIKCRNILA